MRRQIHYSSVQRQKARRCAPLRNREIYPISDHHGGEVRTTIDQVTNAKCCHLNRINLGRSMGVAPMLPTNVQPQAGGVAPAIDLVAAGDPSHLSVPSLTLKSLEGGLFRVDLMGHGGMDRRREMGREPFQKGNIDHVTCAFVC